MVYGRVSLEVRKCLQSLEVFVNSPHPLSQLNDAIKAGRFLAASELSIDSLREQPEVLQRAVYLQCLSLAKMGQWSRMIRRCRGSMGGAQRDLQCLFLLSLLYTGNARTLLATLSSSGDADADTEALRCLMRSLGFIALQDQEQSLACLRAAAFLSPSLIDFLVRGPRGAQLQWTWMRDALPWIVGFPGLQGMLHRPDIESACLYSRQNGGVTTGMRHSLLRAIEVDQTQPRRAAGQP